MGSPEEADSFCRAERLPFRCLSDPDRSAYRAFGLRRGTALEVIGPEPLLRGLRAAARGYFPRMPVGDVYQLGGVFLIDREGSVRYAHYPRTSADHPPAGELRRQVDQLARAAPGDG